MAPEVAEVVREARAAFTRAEQKAELGNDPLRYVLQALSLHLDAQHKLYVDGNLTLAERIKQGQKPDVKEIAEALAAEAKGRIAAGCIGEFNQNLAALMRKHTWRNTLIGAGLLLVTFFAGAGAGYWWHGSQQLVAGLQAGDRTCQDVGGGTQCYIPIWTKLPPAGVQ
jgi:hypothetical protein